MSLIFTRESDTRTGFEAESCILCGNEISRPTRVSRKSDLIFPAGYDDANEIYDIHMGEAVSYLGCTRGKPYGDGFGFVTELWLKQAIHAGLLHGAVYKTGNYFFSLHELDKLRENINFYGGVDPLNKEDVQKYIHGLDDFMLRQDADDYDKKFYHIMLRIGGFNSPSEIED